MEIKDIFTATPRSVSQTLGTSNTGFYIPAYQRQYSWDEKNVKRLFEDTIQGLKHLIENADSITFIGSIIVIKDQNHTTVWPSVREDLPQAVLLVIDGQQRLTTITLLNVELHHLITKKADFFKNKVNQNPAFAWVYNKSKSIENALKKTFLIDMDYPEDPNLKYYPSIIRAFKDSWSRDPNLQKYASPIALYLSQYNSVIFSETPFEFNFLIDEESNENQILKNSIKEIKKQLNWIGKDDPNIDFPNIYELTNSKSVKEILFKGAFQEKGKLEESINKILLSDSPNTSEKKFKEIFRLMTYAQFILNRLALTEVVVKNEDYAFDMFEALNTTGEPLTAFETFKPDIIQAEGLDNYENSNIKGYVDTIESYLNDYSKYNEKQSATSNLLIPFRLKESGAKLSKKLNEQRNYLKSEFRGFNSKDDKREFVKSLSHSALFLKNLWGHDRKALLSDNAFLLEDLPNLCIQFLKDSKHQIIFAPLMRLYSAYLTSENDDNRKKKLEDLIKGIKAVTAFWTIWRSSRRTTDRIDSHYRTLMEKGITSEDGAFSIKPFCRRESENFSVENFILGLKYLLREEGKISGENDYLRKADDSPIYAVSHIAKFILLGALDQTVADKGHYREGRGGLNAVFNSEFWSSEKNLTLEHIAPRTPNRNSDDWDWTIYEDESYPDSIGNLTLLPKDANSSIGNKSWQHKSIFYKAISADTIEDQNQIIESAKETGIQFGNSTIELLNNSSYNYFVASLGDIKDYNLDFIKERSKNILSLYWKRVSPWLDL